MKRGILISLSIIASISAIILVSYEISAKEDMQSLKFIRGDINIDGQINIRDVDYLLSFFYHYHDNLVCEDAADMDDDGIVNINDAIILLDYLYIGNVKELPLPNSKDQIDLTEDNLKC